MLRWNQCIANERTVDQTAAECFPLEMWTKLTIIDFIEMFSGLYIVDILSKKRTGAYKTQLCFIRRSFLVNKFFFSFFSLKELFMISKT